MSAYKSCTFVAKWRRASDLYGSEAWTINKSAQNIVNATEMWFIRRMLKISYIEKLTNKVVLRRAGANRCLIVNIMQEKTSTGTSSDNRKNQRKKVQKKTTR